MPEATPATAPAQAFSVNGQARPWASGLTLAAALSDDVAAAGGDPAALASAVNGAFVARSARAATVLAPGDAVTVFAAIVGG